MSPACPKKGTNASARTSHVIEKQETEEEDDETSSAAAVHVSVLSSYAGDRAGIKVQSLAKPGIAFETLVDTGSYVNLMRESVYKKYYVNKDLIKVNNDMKLKGVNAIQLL